MITVKAVCTIETQMGRKMVTNLKTYGEYGLFSNRDDAAYFSGHDWSGADPRPEIIDCTITFNPPQEEPKK